MRAGDVGDDCHYIVESPLVAQLAALSAYFEPYHPGGAPGPAGAYYRPLSALSHGLERRLLGSDPFGPHLGNLALHLACVALVFCLARRAGGGPWASALAAGCFGRFPRSTEAVTWISARSTLLSTACVLLALRLHDAAAGASRRRCGGSPPSSASCWRTSRCGRRSSRWATSSGSARARSPRSRRSDTTPGCSRPPLGAKMFLGMLGILQPAYLAGGALVAVACAAAVWLALRRPPPPLETAAYAIAAGGIAVALPILPVGDIALTGDRFLHPVLAGLAVGLAAPSAALPSRWATRAGLTALGLLVLFALGSHRRHALWQDELALATDTLERTIPDLRPYAFQPHS